MADDDARVAARWLNWVDDKHRPQSFFHCVLDGDHRHLCDVHPDATRLDYTPDFADPAVYDRALRELAERGMGLRLWFHRDSHGWNCLIERTDAPYLSPSGGRPTIGAAIAAAIAELARAEGANIGETSTRSPQERTETTRPDAGASDSSNSAKTQERG